MRPLTKLVYNQERFDFSFVPTGVYTNSCRISFELDAVAART